MMMVPFINTTRRLATSAIAHTYIMIILNLLFAYAKTSGLGMAYAVKLDHYAFFTNIFIIFTEAALSSLL